MAQERRGQAENDSAVKLERGRRIRRQLWGDDEARPLEVIRRFEPDLADLIVREVFGGFYADERLPLENRSLCTITCLLALGRARQLESHVKAALRIGVPPTTLSALFMHLVAYTGLPPVIDAFHVLAKVLDESSAAGNAGRP